MGHTEAKSCLYELLIRSAEFPSAAIGVSGLTEMTKWTGQNWIGFILILSGRPVANPTNQRLIILGSARTNGNTRKLVEAVQALLPADLADLQELNIGYFDYEHRNQANDFLPFCEKMAPYDHLLFATLIYYSMSAQMKTLFDRIDGLSTIRPDLAERLIGRSLRVIACGSDPSEQELLYKPF